MTVDDLIEALVAAGEAPTPELLQMAERVSNTPWSNFTPADYNDEQWTRACVLDRGADAGTPKSRWALPIREPSGTLNRNGVHAAAAALAGARGGVNATPEQKNAAAGRLRSAYRTLGEQPPDSLAASDDAEEFAADKIRWNEPGAFERCRRSLAGRVPADQISGTCANMEHRATGHWPGSRKSKTSSVDVRQGRAITPVCEPCAASLSASAGTMTDFAVDLNGPTPVTITDDGRIFGHLATWGTCHVAFSGQCVTPPHSETGYSYFHTGEYLTSDGAHIPVGHITMGTGHAAPQLGMRPALEHYDNTGAVVADVAAGEDAHGIWVAGRVRPTATPEQIDALRAAALSGDWRRIGGSMELIAALAVNVPGFPIPRLQSAVREGRQVALVASGVVVPDRPLTMSELIRRAAREAVAELTAAQQRGERVNRLAMSIHRDRASRVEAARQLVHGGQ